MGTARHFTSLQDSIGTPPATVGLAIGRVDGERYRSHSAPWLSLAVMACLVAGCGGSDDRNGLTDARVAE